jgi:hypothetical protein
MKISSYINNDPNDGGPVEVVISFFDGARLLHTITVFIEDPDSYDGTSGIQCGAIRKAKGVIDQMKQIIVEAGMTENERKTELPKS